MRMVHAMLQAGAFVEDIPETSGSRLSEEQMTKELVYATLAYLGVFTQDVFDS